MKVICSVKNKERFTFDKSYNVLADYRKRVSLQHVQDNGFVVINDLGECDMLLPHEIRIVEDYNSCYVFEYKGY